MFGLQTRVYMTSKLLQIVDALTIRNFLKELFSALSAFPGKNSGKTGDRRNRM